MNNLQTLIYKILSDEDYYSKMTESDKELYEECSSAIESENDMIDLRLKIEVDGKDISIELYGIKEIDNDDPEYESCCFHIEDMDQNFRIYEDGEEISDDKYRPKEIAEQFELNIQKKECDDLIRLGIVRNLLEHNHKEEYDELIKLIENVDNGINNYDYLNNYVLNMFKKYKIVIFDY